MDARGYQRLHRVARQSDDSPDLEHSTRGQPMDSEMAERRRDDPRSPPSQTDLPKRVQIAANLVAAVHPWMICDVDFRPNEVF